MGVIKQWSDRMGLAAFRARLKGGVVSVKHHLWSRVVPPPCPQLGLHWATVSGKEGGSGLPNWGFDHQLMWKWNQRHHSVLGSSGKLLPSQVWSWGHLASTLVVVPRIPKSILLEYCSHGPANSDYSKRITSSSAADPQTE